MTAEKGVADEACRNIATLVPASIQGCVSFDFFFLKSQVSSLTPPFEPSRQ